MLGFIFTRHVNSPETNEYWIEAYRCIRKFYPTNIIMIIDDNSDYTYISQPEKLQLTNCFIIQSEFPKRGELLAYYYFNKYNLFDKAVILHDSVFIQKYINFDEIQDIKFIWHFHHHWDDAVAEADLIKQSLINRDEALLLHNKKENWYGVFGVQSVITIDFLNTLIEKYNIFGLLKYVDTRPKRMSVERIFGLLCFSIKPDLRNDPSFFGVLHDYCKWGYKFHSYKKETQNLPIVKVWTER
jgi:hypothetical protein